MNTANYIQGQLIILVLFLHHPEIHDLFHRLLQVMNQWSRSQAQVQDWDQEMLVSSEERKWQLHSRRNLAMTMMSWIVAPAVVNLRFHISVHQTILTDKSQWILVVKTGHAPPMEGVVMVVTVMVPWTVGENWTIILMMRAMIPLATTLNWWKWIYISFLKNHQCTCILKAHGTTAFW